MKLTKEKLKRIIKEELSTMQEGGFEMRDAIDRLIQQLADKTYQGDLQRAKGELINYLKTGDRSSLQGGM